MGPAVEQNTGTWESPWSSTDERPLLLVSLSTTYMGQQRLAERLLQAIAPLPVRALFTTGPALDLSALDIPSNTRVASFVPHAAVLPHASLAVTHAGFGTVQAALGVGVPLVCIPDGRDQPDNAAQ